MSNVIEYFNIGPDATRVAAITYGHSAAINFDFSFGVNKQAALSAVTRIQTPHGGTGTPLALALARTLFTEARGARSLDQGIPRVCLLITDGASNLGCPGGTGRWTPQTLSGASCAPQTIAAGVTLRGDNVNIFAIGAGAPYEPELRGVASPPVEDHLFLIDSAADIPTLVDQMAQTSCEQPARVSPCGQIVETVESGAFKYFQPLRDDRTENVVLEVTVRSGPGVSIYVSGSDPNAGPFHHDVSDNSASATKLISVRRADLSGSALYVAVRGNGVNSSTFVLDVYNDLFPGPTAVYVVLPDGTPRGQAIFEPPTPDPRIIGGRAVQYRLTAYSSAFEIDRQTGQLRTLRQLDVAVQRQYTMVLAVRAAALPGDAASCLKGAIEVRVTVDASNPTPNPTEAPTPRPTGSPMTPRPTGSPTPRPTNFVYVPPTVVTSTPTTTLFIPSIFICTEQDADDCAQGTSCIAVTAGAQCLCSNGFIGDNCNVDVCTLAPCFNGGVCTSVVGTGMITATGFSCACPAHHDEPTCIPQPPVLSDMAITVPVGAGVGTVVGTANASNKVGETIFGLAPAARRTARQTAPLVISSSTGDVAVGSAGLHEGTLVFELTARNVAGGQTSPVVTRVLVAEIVPAAELVPTPPDGSQQHTDGNTDDGEADVDSAMPIWLVGIIVAGTLMCCLMLALLLNRWMSPEHRDKVAFENPMYHSSSNSPLPELLGTPSRRLPPPVPPTGADSNALAGYGVPEQIEAVYDTAADTGGYSTAAGPVATRPVDTSSTPITAQTACHYASSAQAAPITTQAAYHHASSAQFSGPPLAAEAIKRGSVHALVASYDVAVATPVVMQLAYDQASAAPEADYDGSGSAPVYDHAAAAQLPPTSRRSSGATRNESYLAVDPTSPHGVVTNAAAAEVYELAVGGSIGGDDAALPPVPVVQRPTGHVYDLAGVNNNNNNNNNNNSQALPPLPPPGLPSSSGGAGLAHRPVDPVEHAYHVATWYDVAGPGDLDPGRGWNCVTMPKAAWMARLAGMPAGSFVVRDSGKSFAALSFVKPDNSVCHRHIVATPDGLYKLAKGGSLHIHLDALVRHYAQPGQNDLPCPLVVAESDA